MKRITTTILIGAICFCSCTAKNKSSLLETPSPSLSSAPLNPSRSPSLTGLLSSSNPPSELSHLNFPAGSLFKVTGVTKFSHDEKTDFDSSPRTSPNPTIPSRMGDSSPRTVTTTEIEMNLECTPAQTNKSASVPNWAAVLWVTKQANLKASVRDFSGPVGVLNMWRRSTNILKSKASEMTGITGQNSEKEATCGIDTFKLEDNLAGQSFTIKGKIQSSLNDLSPPVLAVLLLKGNKPVSNVLWVSVPQSSK